MRNDSSFAVWKKSVSTLSDESLLSETKSLARSERQQTAWLVAHLAEMWRRDLALKRGYESLGKYAREELGLTDYMAYERVAAARLSLEIPETIERMAKGELSLSAAVEIWKSFRAERVPRGTKASLANSLQAPLLASPVPVIAPATPPSTDEKREIFSQALRKDREETKLVLQEWKRERAGTPKTGYAPLPRPSARRQAHSREWTELSFFLSAEQLAQFDRLRDLLSHKLRTRDPQAALEWMLHQALEKLDPIRKEERVQKKMEKRKETRRENASTNAKSDAPFIGGQETLQQEQEPSQDFHECPSNFRRSLLRHAISESPSPTP